ncbi:MAG: hypothetical protein P8130_00045 [Deltaproteobacteria bacterium]
MIAAGGGQAGHTLFVHQGGGALDIEEIEEILFAEPFGELPDLLFAGQKIFVPQAEIDGAGGSAQIFQIIDEQSNGVMAKFVLPENR